MHLALDPSQTFQTLDGIGASLAWSADPIGTTWSEAARARLADLLFCPERGAGLSAVRFNIGAGAAQVERDPADPWRHPECFQSSADAPFDPSRHAGQQWFVRAAAERGAHCRIAFANSPPIWLTRNGRATHDPSQRGLSSNLLPGGEAAFAEFLAQVAAHFDAIGLPLTALSPVNEPQWAWEDATQEGCRFANDEIRRLAHALRAALDRRGLTTELDLPEAADLRFLIDDDLRCALPDPGRQDPEHAHCREQIRALADVVEGKVCGHGYWTYDPPEQRRAVREAVRATMQRHLPGGRFWQSEVCIMEGGRDTGIDTALRVAQQLHDDLTCADASGWFWWLALSPYDFRDGLIYTDPGEAIQPTKTLWVLGNLARFVRPGWRRIGCTGGDADLAVSAYCAPDGSERAVLLIHSGASDRTVALGDAGMLRAFTTDDAHDLAPSTPPAAAVPVPARSVVTCLLSGRP